MGKDTGIAWTKSTFNAWIGCQKVSPGCTNCYAEKQAGRFPGEWGKLWGPGSVRRITSASYWEQPLKWNRKAAETGEFWPVFCGSMMDVCEDHPGVRDIREPLKFLIEDTRHLTWLLLTKRPENFLKFFPAKWWQDNPHAWALTTVENQEYADKRIPELLKVPAKVRGLSVEPMVGPVDLARSWSLPFERTAVTLGEHPLARRIDWVICGGESGSRARPMHPDWARSLRDQCKAAGVAFFFKQWGSFAPVPPSTREAVLVPSGHGDYATMLKMDKKTAGNHLDGVEYKEFPGV